LEATPDAVIALLSKKVAALNGLNAQLEQRVAERTSALEAANRHSEAFSYSVSHDLRAPVRAMNGFSQAVLEDYGELLPDEGRHYLESIREGAKEMDALIDDLLAFSRVIQAQLQRRNVDTRKLVENVIEELSLHQKGRKIEITTGDIPPCLGDPTLLKQVWINLLSNALKYTRKRERAVVEIGCASHSGEEAYFVRDNGVGFDMHYADQLFGVFQRLPGAEEHEGTGVGLAIVERVIHRHGGRIWANSRQGEGATFYFTVAGGTENRPLLAASISTPTPEIPQC
jgi:light-regulated signal transduction histidine kinase (bacteriophytochrome)